MQWWKGGAHPSHGIKLRERAPPFRRNDARVRWTAADHDAVLEIGQTPPLLKRGSIGARELQRGNRVRLIRLADEGLFGVQLKAPMKAYLPYARYCDKFRLTSARRTHHRNSRQQRDTTSRPWKYFVREHLEYNLGLSRWPSRPIPRARAKTSITCPMDYPGCGGSRGVAPSNKRCGPEIKPSSPHPNETLDVVLATHGHSRVPDDVW